MKNNLAILTLIVGLFTISAQASSVICRTQLNNIEIQNGEIDIIQASGEPEGAGSGQVAEVGNLKIFVESYPLQIYINKQSIDGKFVTDVYKASKVEILKDAIIHKMRETSLSRNIDGNHLVINCKN